MTTRFSISFITKYASHTVLITAQKKNPDVFYIRDKLLQCAIPTYLKNEFLNFIRTNNTIPSVMVMPDGRIKVETAD